MTLNTNKSENLSSKNFFLFEDYETLFKNENTFENYLYQEKLLEKLRNDERFNGIEFDILNLAEGITPDDFFKI